MWPPAQSSSMCGLSRPVRELLTLHFHQGSGVCGPCPKPATELLSPVTQEGLAEVDWQRAGSKIFQGCWDRGGDFGAGVCRDTHTSHLC